MEVWSWLLEKQEKGVYQPDRIGCAHEDDIHPDPRHNACLGPKPKLSWLALKRWKWPGANDKMSRIENSTYTLI